MNKKLNPPCNSPLATSCAKSVTTSPCGQGKGATLLTEGVSSSAEGGLLNIETASTISVAPNVFCARNVCGYARRRGVCPRLFGSSEL